MPKQVVIDAAKTAAAAACLAPAAPTTSNVPERSDSQKAASCTAPRNSGFAGAASAGTLIVTNPSPPSFTAMSNEAYRRALRVRRLGRRLDALAGVGAAFHIALDVTFDVAVDVAVDDPGRPLGFLRSLSLPLFLDRELTCSLRERLWSLCCHAPPRDGCKTIPCRALATFGVGPLRRNRRDVLRLGPFCALGRLELHLRILGERLVALPDDRAVMDEEILAAFVRGDEPVPLVGVEPLHDSGCHRKASFAASERAGGVARPGTRSVTSRGYQREPLDFVI